MAVFAAIHTYGHAIRIMDESGQSSRAAGLCLELANALRDMDKTSEATAFYQRAADLRYILNQMKFLQLGYLILQMGNLSLSITRLEQNQCPRYRSSTVLEYLGAKMKVAECLIDTGDFHSALTALSDVSARYVAYGCGKRFDTTQPKMKT